VLNGSGRAQSGRGAHLSSGPKDTFLCVKAAGAAKLTAHHLVPRLRMLELYLHPAVRLYGVVIN
jgi:hypothetical protein